MLAEFMLFIWHKCQREKRETFRFQNKDFKKGDAGFPWTALPVANLPASAALPVIKSILDSLKASFHYV